MISENIDQLFDENQMDRIFPHCTSDRFFDALLGDADEGAYDIRLKFNRLQESRLNFQFELSKRPDKCLRCSLTYGLPEVFSRHPIIDIEGLVEKIDRIIADYSTIDRWELGKTIEMNPDLHVIPFTIFLKDS